MASVLVRVVGPAVAHAVALGERPVEQYVAAVNRALATSRAPVDQTVAVVRADTADSGCPAASYGCGRPPGDLRPHGWMKMNLAAKFSDDTIVRLGFAPFMLMLRLLVLTNYKGIIEKFYFKSQGREATPFWIILFRIGGSFWVIAAVTLLIGVW
ncbi:hypothetical protein [Streptomyces sp. NPDC003023]|uniref:hypothetical protein n=1 Tax=Streptomyces sp. NPDC003023 TaxID=3364675 RepID=UPI0036C648BF